MYIYIYKEICMQQPPSKEYASKFMSIAVRSNVCLILVPTSHTCLKT